MKKLILCTGLIASLVFAEEVIDKENILNQLKELQKAKSELTRNENSPEAQHAAMRAKEVEEQKLKNVHRIASLKKTITSFAALINNDIVIPRGKYSRVEINAQESFFVFEQDIEELILQKKVLHQKSEKIKLLQMQALGLKEEDSDMVIQKVATDIDSLLQTDVSMMGNSTTDTGTQKPLLELKTGDVYGEYKIHNRNGALTLVRLGAMS